MKILKKPSRRKNLKKKKLKKKIKKQTGIDIMKSVVCNLDNFKNICSEKDSRSGSPIDGKRKLTSDESGPSKKAKLDIISNYIPGSK